MSKNSQCSHRMLTKYYVGVAIVLTALGAYAQAPLDGVALIPVYTATLPGGYGSVWASHLSVRNDGDTPIPITNPQIGFPMSGPLMLEPHRDYDLSANFDALFGSLIWIPASQAGQLVFNARVQDLSRQGQSAGVQIPVVRQGDLRSHIVLLDIPVDGRFRSALRIYDVSGNASNVRVRIFDFDGTQPLVDTNVTLLLRSQGVNPAQANILDVVSAYPALALSKALRIEVDGPPTLWAFISTTNNDTQEVTVVTPN